MFISKRGLEKLIWKEVEDHCFGNFKGMYYVLGGATGKGILERIELIEDYLGIHYEEKTTKGYVKNKRVGKNK